MEALFEHPVSWMRGWVPSLFFERVDDVVLPATGGAKLQPASVKLQPASVKLQPANVKLQPASANLMPNSKPRLARQHSLPPILIEIQLTVNETFMQRLVSYSQSIFHIHKAYPIVQVVCTDCVPSTLLMDKFKPISGKLWMSSFSAADFWAQSCYKVSKLTLSCTASSDKRSPLQALSSFLEASPTLYGHLFAENRTIRQLYQISLTIAENEFECENDISKVVNTICDNNQKMLEKAGAALFGVSGSSKAKSIIERAILFNGAAKRKYCETVNSDSDASLEPLPKLKGKKREINQAQRQDNFEFLKNFKRDCIGRMNWKRCLSVAHEKRLCQNYSTGESLRQFFYSCNKE
ncbi:hypothetical protein [Absidia glauca]|uniref:Uncharacterized protein n=1 Tax=Absidia glauca TaxID=4829 RepID=A0A163KMP3_ABSGL|nr:hypothetical protein [Absidia glauca]